MFEKIMVCLDGSKLAEQILPYATEQARRFCSKLVLLQVWSMSIAEITKTTSNSFELKQQTLNDEAKNYLEKVAAPLKEQGLNVICVTLQGIAEDVIIGYAQDETIDLIAMTTHGRSGLGRTIFGSVADQVLRKSGLPILLIKPKDVLV